MRIAVNSRLLVPGKTDGIARFTIESFKRICLAHPEVEFTFIFDRDHSHFDFGPNTKKLSLLPAARHPILWFIWFEISLKSYLNKNKFDLFISPEGWIPGGLKMPALGVIHDLNFLHLPENVARSHRKFLQHYFPKYAKRADRIATVSEFSKKDIAKSFSIADEQIDVVYNGVNEVFQPLPTKEQVACRKKYSQGKPYFIFIGTLHPRKNLDHLFLAFDLFKSSTPSEIQLLVVGNKKWWPKELEEIYSSMQFKESVIFTGRMEDEELAKILASSIALTYLPHFEGFGIPILEAFASETAVITANNTSLPEVAGSGAILCNSRDPEEIVSAMTKLAFDTNYRAELIEKGKQQLERFSWEKTAEKLWQSAEKCLKNYST